MAQERDDSTVLQFKKKRKEGVNPLCWFCLSFFDRFCGRENEKHLM